MNLDPETIREYVALGGSAIAMASTVYFWWIRSDRERPRMVVQSLLPMTGWVLCNDDYETQRRVGPGMGEVVAKYRLKLVVVNQSLLPNAALALRVSLQLNDGSWRVMDVAGIDGDLSPFPKNVSPMTTQCFDLALAMAINGTLRGGFAEREAAAGDALPPRIPIRIELLGLNEQVFSFTLTDQGQGLSRTETQSQCRAA